MAVQFHDYHPGSASLREAAIAGLSATPKAIAPKFFYDQRGSELFDAICEQPEYYLTRTEERILKDAATEIAALAGGGATLVELGSGASRKVRLLLEGLRPSAYLGVDISREFLLDSTRRLAADFPWLEVHAACADFTAELPLPHVDTGGATLTFFPGSSIGNFDPAHAQTLLAALGRRLPPGSGLLIGVDLIKDRDTLEAAYNDAAGITAAFNRNLLVRLRRELNADIDPERFDHRAHFDAEAGRVEMHLVSRGAQTVHVDGHQFTFDDGESIHTENSWKYSIEGFRELARRAGLTPRALWTDADERFSVHYLETAAA
ncbi:L-histidine N(alpha)-methyltransferase [Arhodomonas sp. AD133]|uniref:L-histidine N(alpha)-methyltransferase n=1 Tax=Arhodomonas sp. AD133 TaxID=3415009 RepID=UPI003EB8D05A